MVGGADYETAILRLRTDVFNEGVAQCMKGYAVVVSLHMVRAFCQPAISAVVTDDADCSDC